VFGSVYTYNVVNLTISNKCGDVYKYCGKVFITFAHKSNVALIMRNIGK